MLKGHLGQKSSPLAPTSCKLSKQMLVLQHMNAHYKKLANAKPSIDMSCPKTLSSSVKNRDTQNRKYGGNNRKPNSRPPSRPSSRLSTDDNHFSSNQAYADDPLVDQIVREALGETESMPSPAPARPSSARYGAPLSPYAANSGRPNSSRPSSSRRALYDSSRSRPSSVGSSSVRAWLARPDDASSEKGQGAGAEGGDIIDCHASRFTESRPFKPRTLRKNVPSKLSQFRYYNKPKTTKKSQSPGRVKDEPENETVTMEEGRRASADVPALRIDADPDKVRWLEQQAEKAKLRQNTGRSFGSPDVETQHTHTMRDFDIRDMSAPVSELMLSGTMQRVHQEEEELKYLEFYSDVTNDILNRGIFTNKVLNQVFQYHLERNKHQLRMSKMQEILGNIRRELGIPEHDDLDDSYGYGVVRPVLNAPESRKRVEPESESGGVGMAAHRPLTDNDIMRYKLQARETERKLNHDRLMTNTTTYEVEDSDLKVCLAADAITDFEHPRVAGDDRDIVPHKEVDDSPSISHASLKEKSESVSQRTEEQEPGARRRTESEMSNQEEVEMTLLHETMRQTYERQNTDDKSESQAEVPERDEPDAAAEKDDFDDQQTAIRSHNAKGKKSRHSSVGGGYSAPLDHTLSVDAVEPPYPGELDRSDSISEPPTPTTRNLMTMTLRPGMMNTLMGRPSEDEVGDNRPHPLARGRLGKSVTFASHDELLETRESEENNATLTDVSNPVLDMSTLNRDLPSVNSEYDDDFEDEDGF